MAAPILVVTGSSGAGKTTVSRLVAATFDPSAHIRIDAFMPFVVNGWIEPWLPESARQNHILGGAVAAAAMQFAEGGYTVVLDGHVFPDALTELAGACLRRGIPLHYAVLRCDLATCVTRARQRDGVDHDPEPFAHQHARFTNLGEHEAHVVDASGAAEDVVAAVRSAFMEERLVVGSPRR